MVAVESPRIRTQSSTTTREQILIRNPVTDDILGHIEAMTAEQVQAVVARAKAAQPAWAAHPVKERCRLLLKWADVLWKHQDTAIQRIREATGKNAFGAWEEVAVLDSIANYYANHAPQWLAPQTRRSVLPVKHTARVYYKPWGVAGFITPWNYPLLNAIQDMIPALIAGNTVVLKPSEVTPYVASFAVDLMHEAGIPRDVVQLVYGAASTGAALVDSVDYIAFTGSTATGRRIAARAAERLIGCSLELGGKDPLIVLADADLDLAASGTLVGALENAGQVCISTERIYVEAPIYDAFVTKIIDYAKQVVVSPAEGMEIHMGSLTNDRELERTEAHIADAVAKGAKVVYGGKRRPDLGPRFFEPTILTNVDHTMKVMTEETFGPLVPLMKVRDAEEAIRLANDNEYGLSAAIFTADLRRGEQLATRIDSGDVNINTTQWTFGTPSLPMGGVKNSGMGRRNGPEGLLRFVRPQSVLVDNQLMSKPQLSLYSPFNIRVAMLLRRVRRWLPMLRI
ncbi:MAG: aldehyde dehydrogenase family protein [Anaerolineae bacterium]|nr:aldehyde dehydrogenase family protein [Anaerolineae bacterium]